MQPLSAGKTLPVSTAMAMVLCAGAFPIPVLISQTAPSPAPASPASSPSPQSPGAPPATPSPNPPAPAENGGAATSSAASEEIENGGDHGIRRTSPDPLTLPAWSPSDARAIAAGRHPNHGDGLFPSEAFPLAAIVGKDGAPLQLDGPVTPPPPLVSTLVETPATRLADPANLLNPHRAATVRQFLASHDAECRFPLRVVMLTDDALKLGIAAPALRDRWFGPQDPTVVLCYVSDLPSHSTLGFSSQTRTDYRPSDLDAVLRGPILETTNVNASHQLEAFLLRLSIELAALEKKPRVPAAPADTVPAQVREVAASPVPPTPTVQEPGFRWTPGKMAALLVLAGGAWALRQGFLARQRRKPVVFPPTDLHPRLGALHSGGAGSVMSFE